MKKITESSELSLPMQHFAQILICISVPIPVLFPVPSFSSYPSWSDYQIGGVVTFRWKSQCSVWGNCKLIMGIDLATWRARIGLNYYHMCRPLQTRWRSSGRLFQPGVASWGVGEIMNDTPLVLKGCMMVVALSLMLQYVRFSSGKNGKGGGGKVHCHWRGTTSQIRDAMDGGGMLLLRAIVVVIPLLLVIAGDVETNPGPPKREGTDKTNVI